MKNESKLLAVLLIINVIMMGVQVVVLDTVTQNQVAIAGELNHIDNTVAAWTDYLKYLSGELLETPTTKDLVLDVHLYVEQWRAGELVMVSEHAGTVTTIGLNYIEELIGNNGTDPSSDRISLSNDAGAPAAGWTEIPNEIVANGLSRASGTYASTGNGVWTITHTFTASGAQSVQLAGLNWAPGGDGNLLCADQITAASLINGDTLELTWTITVT